jgi:S1-C subfamily serine protease
MRLTMKATPFLRPRRPRGLRSAAAALALALCATAAQAQTCEGGRPRTATLGIGLLHCVGGTCMVNARDSHGYRHDFATEPRVWELEPNGPASRGLREGDQITSVDGVLITTREGGRRLANVRAGVPVQLGIRRGGAETLVRVVPEPGCNTPALAVTASAAKPDWRPRPHASPDAGPKPHRGPGVYFGMELDCGDCGWRQENGDWRWHATEPLRVASVVPDAPAQRAGIRPGDVLLRIDGRPLTTGGAGHFAAGLHPGQPVSFEVRRGDRTVRVLVVPELRRP